MARWRSCERLIGFDLRLAHDDFARPFLAAAGNYVRVVLDDEWPVMAACSHAPLAQGSEILDGMWQILVAHEPISDSHKSLYEEALARINKGMELGASFPHIGYYDRALALELLGRYKEAYYDYKKVLELEPRFAMAEERLKDFVVTRVPPKSQS